MRFIRVADKVDKARRDQREREEASQRAASAPPEQKIPEFDANLANLKNNPNRFSVIYFCEQQFDPARQNAVARTLEGCLQAQDQWVGYDACQALKKWGDKNSVQPLVDSRSRPARRHFQEPGAGSAGRDQGPSCRQGPGRHDQVQGGQQPRALAIVCGASGRWGKRKSPPCWTATRTR